MLTSARLLLLPPLFVLLLLLFGAAAGAAMPEAPGDLDPSFGNGGKVVTDLPFPAWGGAGAAILQPDGKILVGGHTSGMEETHFVVQRLLPDGQLDLSFGYLGSGALSFGGLGTEVSAMALQPDGKIVVAGQRGARSGRSDFALGRFHGNGVVDLSFGVGGRVELDFGSDTDIAYDMVIQPDGKIIAVGRAGPNGGGDFAIARFNAGGGLDTSFGSGGKLLLQLSTGSIFGDDVARAVALQPDSKIVVAGSNDLGFAVVRLLNDGRLDPAFDGDGKVVTQVDGQRSAGGALALQADGKILVGGQVSTDSSGFNWALARYNPNGSLDNTFGGDGTLAVSSPFSHNYVRDLAVQPDGKIVAVGRLDAVHDRSVSSDFGAMRFNADGSLDTSLGSAGRVLADFMLGDWDEAREVVLQPGGKILLVGQTGSGTQNSWFALARYDYGGRIDASFAYEGKLITGAAESRADGARAVAVQPDGKILVAGSSGSADSWLSNRLALLRYNPDGRLDTSFAGGMVIPFNGRSGSSVAHALALQPDGKILVGGLFFYGDYEAPRYGLVRYHADGRRDTSFASAESQGTQFFELHSIVVQADGKIVAAGNSNGNFMLGRYRADGTPDTSFGGTGVITRELIFSEPDYARALAVQPDGKLVAGGLTTVYCGGGCRSTQMALLRYNPDGSPDATFGSNGLVTGTAAREVTALRVLGNGKIVAAGTGLVGSSLDFVLLRFNADGSPDTSFGSAGRATADFGAADGANALTLLPDGRLLAAGYSGAGCERSCSSSVFALALFSAGGTLDPSFGGTGKLTTTFASGANIAHAMALQADGRLVVAGRSGSTNPGDIALARYLMPAMPTATGTPAARPTNTAVVPPISSPTAPPSPTVEVACIFSDVCRADFFFTPVQELVRRGAISGYADNTFRPFNNTTRSQLAKIVVVAEALPIRTPGAPTFRDVPADNPSFQFVETAAERGIVGGYADGTFRPYNDVTRGQLAKIVVVAEGWTLENPARQTFVDVAADNPFYRHIETAYARGIISGYADGSYRWANNATRGQIAKIVYQAVTYDR